jgi:hypothetical protein
MWTMLNPRTSAEKYAGVRDTPEDNIDHRFDHKFDHMDLGVTAGFVWEFAHHLDIDQLFTFS